MVENLENKINNVLGPCTVVYYAELLHILKKRLNEIGFVKVSYMTDEWIRHVRKQLQFLFFIALFFSDVKYMGI